MEVGTTFSFKEALCRKGTFFFHQLHAWWRNIYEGQLTCPLDATSLGFYICLILKFLKNLLKPANQKFEVSFVKFWTTVVIIQPTKILTKRNLIKRGRQGVDKCCLMHMNILTILCYIVLMLVLLGNDLNLFPTALVFSHVQEMQFYTKWYKLWRVCIENALKFTLCYHLNNLVRERGCAFMKSHLK